MDTLQQLGYRALASRMKRLSDYCFEQTRGLWDSLSVPFESSYFPYVSHIHREENPTVASLTNGIGVSQPAVSAMVKKLKSAKLITFTTDKQDQRVKLLRLTKKGQEILAHLQPMVESVNAVIAELEREVFANAANTLEILQGLEEGWKQEPLRVRAIRHYKRHAPFRLVPYNPQWQSFYETHNRAWLERYFRVEPRDDDMLKDPENFILSKGGYIFIALLGEYPVGGVSLINEGEGRFELSKMYVPFSLQGFGFGKMILEGAIKEAATLGCRHLGLLSNTSLEPAIHLYRTLGFRELEMTEADKALYQRADIKMEMVL